MTAEHTQYSRQVVSGAGLEDRLLSLGLHREAFTIRENGLTGALVTFWEPDCKEALRILAELGDERPGTMRDH